MFDGAAFGAEMVDVVKNYVEKATGPLVARIADLERQLADRPPAEALKALAQDAAKAAIPSAADLARMVGEEVTKAVAALPPARNGLDVDMEAVERLIATEVARLPVPQDGRSLEPADFADMIAETVEKAVTAIPPAPASRGPDMAEVERLIAAQVAKIPAPKDGESLTPEDVAPLLAAEVQKAIAALPVPKDGVGAAGALIDRDGALVLTLTNGDSKNLGCVVGKDVDFAEVQRLVAAEVAKIPAPKDGRDGFSLDDFDTELLEDGRTLLLKFVRGDTIETHELCFPVVIDRGVYRPESDYVKGDGVTWGGSFWIAQCDTSSKPETNADWRLAVKRGRDGKDLSK